MASPPSSDAAPPPAPPDSGGGPLARRWLLNLVLLAAVVGLGVFAWYRSGHEPTESGTPLTTVGADAVKTIEIDRPHETPVRLERGDAGWHLTAPIKARADTFAVNALLGLLRAPVDATLPPDAAGLSRYGLDHPGLTVHFDKISIDFGESRPFKDEHYVAHGSVVRLISSRYYRQAARPYADLIDSRLVDPGRRLDSIRLADFTLTLKDGTWQRDPEIKTLSSDRINAFVDEWQHARALRVEAHAGSAKPEETVVLGFTEPDGGSGALTVDVLAHKPELVLYRSDEGLDYHFPRDTAARLLKLDQK